MELLKVLKRRNYPLAFRENATNEDIVHAMSGKLAQTVFLRRETQHNYPSLVFSHKTIHTETDGNDDDEMEVCPQEHLVEEAKEPSKAKGRGKKAQAAPESLITRWIKEPNAPSSTNP